MALIRRNVENGNNQVRTTDRPQILFRMNLSFVEVEYFYIRKKLVQPSGLEPPTPTMSR